MFWLFVVTVPRLGLNALTERTHKGKFPMIGTRLLSNSCDKSIYLVGLHGNIVRAQKPQQTNKYATQQPKGG